jgi:hypothetical protein
MKKSTWLAFSLAAISAIFSITSARAQKLDASVLYRQDSDVAYHAVIPGYSGPNADVTGACTLDPDPANCPSVRNSAETSAEPTYTLIGTTLSLGLPDGRIAVVNCIDRHSARGNYINRHSCGMPLVERVGVEFNGQSAKLTWPAGPDGKRTESETYKVVAVLAQPTDNNQVASTEGPASR